jgi:hypothetical protein
MVPRGDYVSEKDLESSRLFDGISPPSNFARELSPHSTNLIFGESLLVLYLEAVHVVFLFETLLTYHLE